MFTAGKHRRDRPGPWISRYTVKDHVKAVYAKLGVASRAELSAKVFYEHVASGLGGQQVRQFDRAELAS